MGRSRKIKSYVTFVRALDLIKIANQLYNDKMEFARIAITFSDDDEIDGSVQIHAIPAIDSVDVKEYPLIKNHPIADFDDLIV